MYTPTIGIEVHVELKTKRKVFSASTNNYNDSANTNVNEVDFAYPGTLPTLNKEVIDKSLLAALGLNFEITKKMHFDRKNYFYPDLPKGYQITQERTPIGRHGYITLSSGKKITIERMHIEEDTCKSIHEDGRTLLNYNRAGVPLIEIVSDPVIASKEEAMEYLNRLRELLFYLNVSDCKIEEGSMRADVNVSISKTDKLGTKVEVKNIGSIKDVGIAIDYEIKRQQEILDNNGTIEEETRRFDSKTNTTILMRKKEIGNEYRYLPEPDIPYVYITDEEIENTKQKLQMLPDERRRLYIERGISPVNVEKIINNKALSDYLNKFINTSIDFRIASNLLLGDISSYLNRKNIKIEDTKLTKETFIEVVNMLESKEINNNNFKAILDDLMETDNNIKEILKSHDISNMDTNALEDIIKKVLNDNMESVNDYKNGKTNAAKYLMGMAMKETKGKANPKDVNDMLNSLLNKM